MPPELGLTLLVAVVALGLAHLAVHASRLEYVVTSAVVWALVVPLAVVAPAAGTSRLAAMGVMPDRLPPEWG